MLDNKSIKFGEFLKRMRKEKLQSQEELAHLSNRDRRFISDLERDKSQPSLSTIVHIAFALKMKPSELMKEFEESTELLKYFNEQMMIQRMSKEG